MAPRVVTGGPELLHQLGAELRDLGFDAAMCYYPFRNDYETPEPYVKYEVPIAPFEDRRDIFYVVPEVTTPLVHYLKRARSAIWWLSVHNYQYQPKFSVKPFRPAPPIEVGMLQRMSPGRLRWSRCLHFSQSQFATDFLAGHRIRSQHLGDYVNAEFLEGTDTVHSGKTNTIAYNPAKGIEVTQRLLECWPEFDWLPLTGMTRAELVARLRSVKLYIDFGHHPGKDRIPREAAVSGACVITGREGAAANSVDVPIPEKYKLDQEAPDFTERFGGLVRDIFVNFRTRSAEFDAYRERTKGERAAFRADVERIFSKLG